MSGHQQQQQQHLSSTAIGQFTGGTDNSTQSEEEQQAQHHHSITADGSIHQHHQQHQMFCPVTLLQQWQNPAVNANFAAELFPTMPFGTSATSGSTTASLLGFQPIRANIGQIQQASSAFATAAGTVGTGSAPASSSSASSGSPQMATGQQGGIERKPSPAELLAQAQGHLQLAGQHQQQMAAVALAGLQGHQNHATTGGSTNNGQQQQQRDSKPFKCPHCPKQFANNSYLTQHMRIHLGIRAFGPCQFCGKKFTQLSHLQQHIRTHTGEKPYKCKYANCEKAFSQLSNLQSHSRCHQSDRPFKCNSCYKCFADEQTLLEHIPRHKESKHLKASSKVHICPFCGKSYSQALYLDKHMTKHTDRRAAHEMRFANSTTGKPYYTNGATLAVNGVDSFDLFDVNLGQLQAQQNSAGTTTAAEQEFTKQFQIAMQQQQQTQQQQQSQQPQQQQQLSSVTTAAAAAALTSAAATNSALAGYGAYGGGNGSGTGGGAGNPFGTDYKGPMATANVVNQMAIGNSALNFFQRNFQQNGNTAARGFNMITPLENIKHFNSSNTQQQGGTTANFQ